MTVFVAAHKDFGLELPSEYKVIQVGASGKGHFSDVADDTGDNISFKNPNFCELTAQYWIWKNCKDDAVGLCHYRRFFYTWPRYLLRTLLGINTRMISGNEISEILSRYDAIVTLPCVLRKTVWVRYGISHYIEDLEWAKKIIEKEYPEYMPAFKEAMNRKQYHYGNMIICNKTLYDSYSSWLFSILFEVEKHTDVSMRPPYQQRAYGFLSERLLDVYLLHNKVKIKQLPVIVTDEPLLIVQVLHFLKRKIKRFLFPERK